MADLTHAPSGFARILAATCGFFTWRHTPAMLPPEPQDPHRAERDFMLETLERHPDVFESELDIHHLARLYRSRF